MTNTILFDKQKFPWKTGVSSPFSKVKSYPLVSVVVPSYNQGVYLEETLLSIIGQQYPNLELIVIDGGSTDESVDIIKKYEEHITYWVSEKDRGQSHAINKGFEKCTGEWIAWMNSDDCYLEGAFYSIFEKLPYRGYDFLFGNCSPGVSFASRHYVHIERNYRNSLTKILLFFHSTQYMIPSQSVFVRKAITAKTGFLNENCHYVMDLDWYARIYLATNKRLFYKFSICFYRINETTKTGSSYDKMVLEAKEVTRKYLPYLSFIDRFYVQRILDESDGFNKAFNLFSKLSWRSIISIAIKFPFSASSNIHFLAYIKNKLLGK